MADYKTIELTVISAKHIKHVKHSTKMDVYVVVYLSDQPKNKAQTLVHQDCGTFPSWNHKMRFNVSKHSTNTPGACLVFRLLCRNTLGGDRDLGEVTVSLMELNRFYEGSCRVQRKQQIDPLLLSGPVMRAHGKVKGELMFSYVFVDKVEINFGGRRLNGTSVVYPPSGMTAAQPLLPPQQRQRCRNGGGRGGGPPQNNNNSSERRSCSYCGKPGHDYERCFQRQGGGRGRGRGRGRGGGGGAPSGGRGYIPPPPPPPTAPIPYGNYPAPAVHQPCYYPQQHSSPGYNSWEHARNPTCMDELRNGVSFAKQVTKAALSHKNAANLLGLGIGCALNMTL